MSTSTESLDITVVDPDSLLPLPASFSANDAGEYSLSGVMILNGDTLDPIGELEIAGMGDPRLSVQIELDVKFITASDTFFASIGVGIEIEPAVPSDWSLQTTQVTNTTGSAGTPPVTALNSSSIFLETADRLSTNALDAGVGGVIPVPGNASFDSGTVETPALPDGTTETGFNVLVVQNDISLFDLAADAQFALQTTTETELILRPLSGLPGDYNGDGKVDAADYVVWRRNVGMPAGTLPNDPLRENGNPIGSGQLDVWRANFGSTISSSEKLPAQAVPEPATALLLIFFGAAPRSRRVFRRCGH